MPNQSSFQYDFEVPSNGRLEVPVPLPAGSRVTVYVVERHEQPFADLVALSASSTDFWDNQYDDQDWNNA